MKKMILEYFFFPRGWKKNTKTGKEFGVEWKKDTYKSSTEDFYVQSLFFSCFSVVPEPVANCTTINPSAEHFRLSCKPGFDGGMEQYFEVIVRENNSGAIVYNITIAKGLEKLDVRNLSAGVSYIATLTPRNKKGPGQSINFEFDTIMHPKVEVTQVEDAASAAASGSSTESENDGFFNSEITVMIGGILAGILVSFGVLGVVGFICVQNRQTMNPSSGKVQVS